MVVQDLLFTESLIETDEGRVLSFLPPSYLQTDNHLKLNPVIYSKPKQNDFLKATEVEQEKIIRKYLGTYQK